MKHSCAEINRQKIGMRCGIWGILLNALLFAGKLLIGLISGSIAVMADAFNNLLDAGSSVLTVWGFRMSGKQPDSEHPYGHGRMEYVSGLLTAVVILFTAFELFASSVSKILHPEPVVVNALSIFVLSVCIVVKIGMALVTWRFAKRISSEALMATAVDYRNDVFSTTLVLGSALVEKYAALAVDGWCGVVLACFIFVSGIASAKKTIDSILGYKPDSALIEGIRKITESHEYILGVHDILVHDYGPARRMVTLHAEVPADGNLVELHTLIEHIQHEIEMHLGCSALIHLDPVLQENADTLALRRWVCDILAGISAEIGMHDFQFGERNGEAMLSFDVQVPFGFKMEDQTLKNCILREIGVIKNCVVVVHIDRV